MARFGRSVPLRGRVFTLRQPIASAVTGTGAVTTTAASLSGTGAQTVTGTGAVTSTAAILSGTGAQTDTGTGAVTTTAATVSGTGAQTYAGTGVVTSTAASLSGTGDATYAGTGALTSAAATLAADGSVVTGTVGTGSVTTTASSLDGTGTVVGTATTTGGFPAHWFDTPSQPYAVRGTARLRAPRVDVAARVRLVPPPPEPPPAPLVASVACRLPGATMTAVVWVDRYAGARRDDDDIATLVLALAHD